MYTLENEFLRISVKEQGAELTSLFDKKNQLENLWQGNPEFWSRQSPVLFPFVGGLKEKKYTYQGQTYPMGQHGFARDSLFKLSNQSDNSLSFELLSDDQTRAVYPFDFKLTLTYQLVEQTVTVRYQVENPMSGDPLYFSIGGHPAFNVPLEAGLTFNDYQVRTIPAEHTVIPLVGPFIDTAHKSQVTLSGGLPLSRETFNNDAHIFETGSHDQFIIESAKSERKVIMDVEDALFTGIWSPYPKEAPFVCLEPWWGIADDLQATGDLTQKIAIQELAPKQIFKAQYHMTIL